MIANDLDQSHLYYLWDSNPNYIWVVNCMCFDTDIALGSSGHNFLLAMCNGFRFINQNSEVLTMYIKKKSDHLYLYSLFFLRSTLIIMGGIQ